MKHRVLDVMNEALGLVKKSDLGGATALIRKALSGEPASEDESGDFERAPLPSLGEGHSVSPTPPVGRNAARLAHPADTAARTGTGRTGARAGSRRTVLEAQL